MTQSDSTPAVWQSQFATYVRSLEPSRMRALRLDESTIVTAEILVTICKLISDEDDSRTWIERLNSYFDNLDNTAVGNILEEIMGAPQGLNTESWLANALTGMEDGKAKSWIERYRAGAIATSLCGFWARRSTDS